MFIIKINFIVVVDIEKIFIRFFLVILVLYLVFFYICNFMFICFIDYDIRMVYIKCQSLYVLQLEFNESKEKVIVFFKVSLEVIILDNFYINIIVFTMIDFFLSIFYYVVQKIYVFLMLEDGKWSRIFDFKLQSLISELEVGFGSVIRKQDFLFKGKGDNVDNLGSM